MSNTSEVLKNEMIDTLVQLLQEDGFRKDLTKAINEDIDIPIINEKTEKKIINRLFDVMSKEVVKVLGKMKQE
jgi:hypothetical protein